MMIARIRNGAMFALATVAGALPALGFAPSIAAEQSPVGAYLWYPDPGGPQTDQDCRDLVAHVKPTKEKAERSLWGTIPENDPAADTFYLLLSDTRMDLTYAAEGDYDFGNVQLGETLNGETPFKLVPDDHPDVIIHGTIVAKPDSDIVTVTWRGIPLDDIDKNRTVKFCRFDLGTAT